LTGPFRLPQLISDETSVFLSPPLFLTPHDTACFSLLHVLRVPVDSVIRFKKVLGFWPPAFTLSVPAELEKDTQEVLVSWRLCWESHYRNGVLWAAPCPPVFPGRKNSQTTPEQVGSASPFLGPFLPSLPPSRLRLPPPLCPP